MHENPIGNLLETSQQKVHGAVLFDARIKKLIYHLEHLLCTAHYISSNTIEVDSTTLSLILKYLIEIKKGRGDNNVEKFKTGRFNSRLVSSSKRIDKD